MAATIKKTCRIVAVRTMLFLMYLFLGAGIFLAIEQDNTGLEKAKKRYTNYLNRFCKKHNISSGDQDEIEQEILAAYRSGYFKSVDASWNFVNAFVFSGNVVTTIGYGHIVPQTDWGKAVCMIYALFGIPLTGFFLRTVGNELTNLIGYLIRKIERRFYNREAEKIEMKSAIVTTLLALIMLVFGGGMFFTSEKDWTYLDSFYYSFISLTTIGFGDLIPGLGQRKEVGESITIELAVLVYYVIGLSIMSGVIVSISSLIEEKTKKLDFVDPMEAMRNIRMENLNTKALKKLGYKVTNGPLDGDITLPRNLGARRGTIVPDDSIVPRRISRLLEQSGALHKGNRNQLNVIPPMIPNGTVRQRTVYDSDSTKKDDKESIKNGGSQLEASKQETTEANTLHLRLKKDIVVDVNISPTSSRASSATNKTVGNRVLSAGKNNKVFPSQSDKSNEINTDNKNNQINNSKDNNCCMTNQSNKTQDTNKNDKTTSDNRTENKTSDSENIKQCHFKHDTGRGLPTGIGLPSEIFASSFYAKQNTQPPNEREKSSSIRSMDTELEEIEEYYSNEITNDTRAATSPPSIKSPQNSNKSRTPDALKSDLDSISMENESDRKWKSSDYGDPVS